MPDAGRAARRNLRAEPCATPGESGVRPAAGGREPRSGMLPEAVGCGPARPGAARGSAPAVAARERAPETFPAAAPGFAAPACRRGALRAGPEDVPGVVAALEAGRTGAVGVQAQSPAGPVSRRTGPVVHREVPADGTGGTVPRRGPRGPGPDRVGHGAAGQPRRNPADRVPAGREAASRPARPGPERWERRPAAAAPGQPRTGQGRAGPYRREEWRIIS